MWAQVVGWTGSILIYGIIGPIALCIIIGKFMEWWNDSRFKRWWSKAKSFVQRTPKNVTMESKYHRGLFKNKPVSDTLKSDGFLQREIEDSNFGETLSTHEKKSIGSSSSSNDSTKGRYSSVKGISGTQRLMNRLSTKRSELDDLMSQPVSEPYSTKEGIRPLKKSPLQRSSSVLPNFEQQRVDEHKVPDVFRSNPKLKRNYTSQSAQNSSVVMNVKNLWGEIAPRMNQQGNCSVVGDDDGDSDSEYDGESDDDNSEIGMKNRKSTFHDKFSERRYSLDSIGSNFGSSRTLILDEQLESGKLGIPITTKLLMLLLCTALFVIMMVTWASNRCFLGKKELDLSSLHIGHNTTTNDILKHCISFGKSLHLPMQNTSLPILCTLPHAMNPFFLSLSRIVQASKCSMVGYFDLFIATTFVPKDTVCLATVNDATSEFTDAFSDPQQLLDKHNSMHTNIFHRWELYAILVTILLFVTLTYCNTAKNSIITNAELEDHSIIETNEDELILETEQNDVKPQSLVSPRKLESSLISNAMGDSISKDLLQDILNASRMPSNREIGQNVKGEQESTSMEDTDKSNATENFSHSLNAEESEESKDKSSEEDAGKLITAVATKSNRSNSSPTDLCLPEENMSKQEQQYNTYVDDFTTQGGIDDTRLANTLHKHPLSPSTKASSEVSEVEINQKQSDSSLNLSYLNRNVPNHISSKSPSSLSYSSMLSFITADQDFEVRRLDAEGKRRKRIEAACHELYSNLCETEPEVVDELQASMTNILQKLQQRRDQRLKKLDL